MLGLKVERGLVVLRDDMLSAAWFFAPMRGLGRRWVREVSKGQKRLGYRLVL